MGVSLSVVLPCFNGEATLAVQLDALCRQTRREGWELVVVDNGSTDGSRALAERYRDRLPLRIVAAHTPGTPRLPVAHSYETGIAAARGDAFAFCEADDEVSDGWLEALSAALEAHPFVVGALAYERLNAPWTLVGRRLWQAEGLVDLVGPPHGKSFTGCNLAMRRAFYERVGPIETTYRAAWDTDYCERILAAGLPIHFARDAVIHYRLRDEPTAAERQGYVWGLDLQLLAARYHARPPTPKALVRYLRLVRGAARHQLRRPPEEDRGERLKWAWNAGWHRGTVEGYWRHTVLGVVPPLARTQRVGAGQGAGFPAAEPVPPAAPAAPAATAAPDAPAATAADAPERAAV